MAKANLSTITDELVAKGIPPVSEGAHVFVLQNNDLKLRIDCYVGNGEDLYKIGDKTYKDVTMSYSVVLTKLGKSIYSTAGAEIGSFPLSELVKSSKEAKEMFDSIVSSSNEQTNNGRDNEENEEQETT